MPDSAPDPTRGVRRRAVLGGVAAIVVSGCLGVLPDSEQGGPQYPGGTVVVEHTGSTPAQVTVRMTDPDQRVVVDTTVDPGTTVVRRRAVTVSTGTVVTLAADLGDGGDPISFEFLPSGTTTAPPEVAVLTIQSDVTASAEWTATAGTDPRDDA